MNDAGGTPFPLQACPQCAAPLQPPDARGSMRCKFCGTTVQGAANPAHAGELGHDVRAQRRREIEAPTQLRITPPKSSTLMPVLTFVAVFVVVTAVLLGIGLWALRRHSASSQKVTIDAGFAEAPAQTSATPITSVLPAVCPTAGSLTVRNASYSGSGVAIDVHAGCKLVVASSSIASTNGIVAATGSTVAITDSVIRAQDTGIELGSGVTLAVSGASEIDGAAAINGDLGAIVTLNGTIVRATRTGIHTGANSKVVLSAVNLHATVGVQATTNETLTLSNQTSLVAVQQGISADGNPTIAILGSAVEGDLTAIDLQGNAVLSLVDATVSSPRVAISAPAQAMLRSSGATTVQGPTMVAGHVSKFPHNAGARTK